MPEPTDDDGRVGWLVTPSAASPLLLDVQAVDAPPLRVVVGDGRAGVVIDCRPLYEPKAEQ